MVNCLKKYMNVAYFEKFPISGTKNAFISFARLQLLYFFWSSITDLISLSFPLPFWLFFRNRTRILGHRFNRLNPRTLIFGDNFFSASLQLGIIITLTMAWIVLNGIFTKYGKRNQWFLFPAAVPNYKLEDNNKQADYDDDICWYFSAGFRFSLSWLHERLQRLAECGDY